MQVDLEAPQELVALLAARGATHPLEPPLGHDRPALSVTAPNEPAITAAVELDLGLLATAGTTIQEWYRDRLPTTTGPWRLAVYLRSGDWASAILRPSTSADAITRFLATLDVGRDPSRPESDDSPQPSSRATGLRAPA